MVLNTMDCSGRSNTIERDSELGDDMADALTCAHLNVVNDAVLSPLLKPLKDKRENKKEEEEDFNKQIVKGVASVSSLTVRK
uniref:Uncharacterized protein n=1 Tax=Glossina palpalis gambiensis TaxID=67801 RepID=A0A1B0AMK4_9MUSC